MVCDLDADARMTIAMRFISGALQNLILLVLKLREARTALHWRMHDMSSDTAPRNLEGRDLGFQTFSAADCHQAQHWVTMLCGSV
jgi:hypothetical protein